MSDAKNADNLGLAGNPSVRKMLTKIGALYCGVLCGFVWSAARRNALCGVCLQTQGERRERESVWRESVWCV